MKCLDTDLDAVFASSAFGEANGTVTWKGLPIVGAIFDDEDVQVDMGEGVTEIVHQSMLTSRSSNFPDIADGDPVVIGTTNYKVKHWSDDGTGVIEIYMEEQ